AEKEGSQKLIILLVMIGFGGLLVVAALDHRFSWSRMPGYVCWMGDALIAIGFVLVFFVLKVNAYAASTVEVAEDQEVISTGLYAFVRHPMYAMSFPIIVGMALALGSWWGLSALIVFVPALIWRLVNEESLLRKSLPGYIEYAEKVRYRLVPFLW